MVDARERDAFVVIGAYILLAQGALVDWFEAGQVVATN